MSKVTKEILIVESEAVVYAQYKHREETQYPRDRIFFLRKKQIGVENTFA